MRRARGAAARRRTLRRAEKLLRALEEGWCYAAGYLLYAAEQLWGRASRTQLRTVLKALVELGELRRASVHGRVLYCRGDKIKGVKLVSGSREAAVTAEAVKRLLAEVVSSMKSRELHVSSQKVAERLGVSPSPALNAAVAFLLYAIDGAHFAGLTTRREKTYFLFRK